MTVFSNSRKITIISFLMLILCSNLPAQFEANWESLEQRQTPQWWSDAKFGIFIHWGLYSVPAYAPTDEVESVYEKYAEHYYNRLLQGNSLFTNFHEKQYGKNFKYADFASMFKAQFFNPDEWSTLFEKAGAKYVVLTSKHHDGFCLWPSTQSPQWNSVVMGPGIDIIDSLSKSVRNKRLKFGLYYSLLEWNQPLYSPSTMNRWVDEHMIPQMKELVINYKPEIIFADGEWDYKSDALKSEYFLQWLYNESPVKQTVVVNDRWGIETRSKHGDYYTTEYDLVHDQTSIGTKITHPWEESRGIGTSYGYNKFETSEHYLSSKELIDILIQKVANGGNFLLNIGPDASGLIPIVMQERLLDIGKWLKINGEAIYKSRPWDKNSSLQEKGIYFTVRDKNLYMICTKWQNKPIVISNLKKAGKVEMLGYNGKIKSRVSKGKLSIELPNLNIAELPSTHAWVIKIMDFN